MNGERDPAGISRHLPDLDAATVDDAKAARLGHTLVELLERFVVA